MSGLARRRGAKKVVDEDEDGNFSGDSQLDTDMKGLSLDSKKDNAKKQETTEPYLTLLEEVLLVGLKDKEGYLSFWNDNISYALRGLILIELALRNKIRMINDPARKRFELPDRLIEVVDTTLTGETLLDEALKLIKNDKENLSVLSWVDLLSGETWNLMKINYQLKQVRERLAKGLVDKGVLKTEHKNFLLFDMATHPINDPVPKRKITNRILGLLTSRNFIYESDEKYYPDTLDWKYLRAVILVCGCSAANVLENVLVDVNFDARDQAFVRSEELLENFNDFPFTNKSSKSGLGMNLMSEIDKEVDQHPGFEMNLEVVAAVIFIFSKMDTII
ncbi:hypothetical protein CANINC_001022 [Pichia inconspicua]|uniref:Vacuolar protein sorting-associated protein 74 n=1 Tax=Pichia inconspicua TaxID=52247 RepID=A0A4T0X4M5_9ASCO|nr:hypothetical protein CANINC_001022 [[Candida] inconspicua]